MELPLQRSHVGRHLGCRVCHRGGGPFLRLPNTLGTVKAADEVHRAERARARLDDHVRIWNARYLAAR